MPLWLNRVADMYGLPVFTSFEKAKEKNVEITHVITPKTPTPSAKLLLGLLNQCVVTTIEWIRMLEILKPICVTTCKRDFNCDKVETKLDLVMTLCESDARFIPGNENIDFVIKSTATQLYRINASHSQALPDSEIKNKVTYSKCSGRRSLLQHAHIVFESENSVYESVSTMSGATVMRFYEHKPKVSLGEYLLKNKKELLRESMGNSFDVVLVLFRESKSLLMSDEEDTSLNMNTIILTDLEIAYAILTNTRPSFEPLVDEDEKPKEKGLQSAEKNDQLNHGAAYENDDSTCDEGDDISFSNSLSRTVAAKKRKSKLINFTDKIGNQISKKKKDEIMQDDMLKSNAESSENFPGKRNLLSDQESKQKNILKPKSISSWASVVKLTEETEDVGTSSDIVLLKNLIVKRMPMSTIEGAEKAEKKKTSAQNKIRKRFQAVPEERDYYKIQSAASVYFRQF
mmetsp:Transcript_18430/g.22575  ORF Transcript_18430/g.22575 Transcript_18430/m.22575 type:complete len:458 (-) Transcript_18430:2347-3720(-)